MKTSLVPSRVNCQTCFLPRNQIFIQVLLFREDQITESESRRKGQAKLERLGGRGEERNTYIKHSILIQSIRELILCEPLCDNPLPNLLHT